MAYTPTNWKSGDVVTSAKLNKLEQGVADCLSVVTIYEDGGSLAADMSLTDAAAIVHNGGNLMCKFFTACYVGTGFFFIRDAALTASVLLQDWRGSNPTLTPAIVAMTSEGILLADKDLQPLYPVQS